MLPHKLTLACVPVGESLGDVAPEGSGGYSEELARSRRGETIGVFLCLWVHRSEGAFRQGLRRERAWGLISGTEINSRDWPEVGGGVGEGGMVGRTSKSKS